jgi:hypothetical protein
MNTLRKLIGLLLITAFALSSGASFGGDKQYALTVGSSTATPQPALTFAFTNQGNSSFNSLKLTLPPGWTISMAGGASAVRSPNTTVADVTVNGARNAVTINGINLPTGTGKQTIVTVTGIVAPVCGSAQTGGSTAQVWTGSTVGSGQTFAPVGTYPFPTTVTTPCITVTSRVGAGNGSITPASQQVSPGTGAAFNVSATSPGNHIDTIGGTCPAGALVGGVYTTGAIVGACEVVANFAVDTFTVSTSFDNTKGTISPTSRTGVEYGATTTFTVSALSGFHTTSASGCGGSLTGTLFTTAAITGACTVTAAFAANTLTFTTAPSKVTAGTPFTVAVTADGPDTAVSLTSTCPNFTATGPTVSGKVSTFSANVGTVPVSDSCSITAAGAATDYPTSISKTVSVISGNVNCDTANYVATKPGIIDPNNTFLDLTAVTTNDYGIRRGPNIPGGSDCAYVDVSMKFPNPWTSHFTYDKQAGTQKGNFKYMIVWGEVAVDAASAWTDKRPKVAWVEDTSGNPVYVPALACIDDDLSLGSGLMPVLPSVFPFTAAGLGGTYSDYLADGTKKAKMCVAQHGWRSMNIDTDPNSPNYNKLVIQYWTKIVDQGDSWAAIDQ